jgi:hypothetical protein
VPNGGSGTRREAGANLENRSQGEKQMNNDLTHEEEKLLQYITERGEVDVVQLRTDYDGENVMDTLQSLLLRGRVRIEIATDTVRAA